MEGKTTTGGYLGTASFSVHGVKVKIQIEVSLRNRKPIEGTRTLIEGDYIPAYTLVHLPIEKLIKGKLEALFARQKPRDFYDYLFLLSGNYPIVKDKENLEKVLKLLEGSKINFKVELRRFLPVSHVMILKDFKSNLITEIEKFI